MRDPGARQRARETLQAQRQAATQFLARERALRQVLETLDPQPDDIHLDYPALLDRVVAVVQQEQRQTAAGWV